VQEVMKIALETPASDPSVMFDNVFENIPENLRKQRDTMRTDSIGQDPEQIGLKRAQQASGI
jgi:hypothetical protein